MNRHNEFYAHFSMWKENKDMKTQPITEKDHGVSSVMQM